MAKNRSKRFNAKARQQKAVNNDNGRERLEVKEILDESLIEKLAE